jgi:hypothetical protein
VDQYAQIKVEKMVRENPQFESVCNFMPIKADLSANYQLNNLLMKMSEQKSIQRAYVCLGNPILSLQVGLILGQIPNLFNTKIYVRLEKDSGLSGIIANPISGIENSDNLIPFDIYEETCTGALFLGGTHELLARKLFKNYQLSFAVDSSQPISNWNDLPEQEKNSNRKQAGRVHTLLQSFGYLISPLQDWTARDFIFPNEDLQNMARMEHDLWCLWKQENGWHYGKYRDNKEKSHPDLKPWEELSESEQKKNIDFIQNIPGMLAELGFQIDRIIR